MSATVLTPADASAIPACSQSGHRTVNAKGQILHVDAALLDVEAVAAMLNCSPRHVYRLSDGARMPAPVKLGALVRWSAAAIREWIAAGCPKCDRRAGR